MKNTRNLILVAMFAFFYGFLICVAGDFIITLFTAYISVKIIPILKKSGYIYQASSKEGI